MTPIQAFKAGMRRDPTGSEHAQVAMLVVRHGEEVAARIISILSSPDFAWVKDDKLSFALNSRTFEKHIEPKLKAPVAVLPQGGGEQAEFGMRPDGRGYRRVW